MGNSAFSLQNYGEVNDVVNEVPSGTINGSNQTFTTAQDYIVGSVQVYRNGVRLKGDGNDFTAGGSQTISMTTAPATGDTLLVDYDRAVTSSGDAATVGGYTPTSLLDVAYHTNPYKFHAYRSASGETATGKINLDAVVYDHNSDYDITTNYRYDVPVDGFYQINFATHFAVTAGIGYYATIQKNGTQVCRGSSFISGYTNGSAWGGSNGSGLLTLEAGDYLELHMSGNSNGISNASSTTFMSGFLVSKT